MATFAIGGLVYLNVRPTPAPASGTTLGTYATSLGGRTQGQRHNAIRAATELNDAIIPPGATFSYNRRVRAWATEPGYWKAPVSYAGSMTLAVGGGVCQTSSTLYNAALLAGLEISERHPHTALPRYVPPGRDAAVAYPGIDLRLKNPHPFPVRIRFAGWGGGSAHAVDGAGYQLNIRIGDCAAKRHLRGLLAPDKRH